MLFTIGQRVNTFWGIGTIVARDGFIPENLYTILLDSVDYCKYLLEWGYSDRGLLIRKESHIKTLDFVDPAMA